jgi:hypothetical protein
MSTIPQAPRQVAAFTSIVVALALIGLAMWGGTAALTTHTGETPRVETPWLMHFLAGALVIGGVLFAQRWRLRLLGQIMLVVAAALLLLALLVFRYFGLVAWATLVGPAVILLALTPFLGPVPRAPDDAGRR